MELNQRVMYSQFFSKICTGTGLNPTRERAVREMTEEAPVLENALPCKPVFPLSCSELASWRSMIGLPGSQSKAISSMFLYTNEYTVNKELSVVPEIGMENLLPSSS